MVNAVAVLLLACLAATLVQTSPITTTKNRDQEQHSRNDEESGRQSSGTIGSSWLGTLVGAIWAPLANFANSFSSEFGTGGNTGGPNCSGGPSGHPQENIIH